MTILELFEQVKQLPIPERKTLMKLIIDSLDTPILKDQSALIDLSPLSVGEWREGLELISREEYYDDDGR
jgi:hypothetical protein